MFSLRQHKYKNCSLEGFGKNLTPEQKKELLICPEAAVGPGTIEIITALAGVAVAIFNYLTKKEENRNKNGDKKYLLCCDCGTIKEI